MSWDERDEERALAEQVERVRSAPAPPEFTEMEEATEELLEARADPDNWPVLRRTNDLRWDD